MRCAMLVLLAAAAMGQTPSGPGRMAFEVASVKLSKPGAFFGPNFPLDAGDSFTNMATGEKPRGRFRADFPLSVYISFAYKLQLSPEQRQALLGPLPKWVSTDSFEIEARAAGEPGKDEMRLMMQALLADRFQLTVHFESRETPVLLLTLAKPGKMGPKLHLHSDGPACDAPAGAEVFPPACDVQVFMRKDQRNRAGSRNTTLELLATSLSGLGRLSRPVVDQTGIVGRVDFSLEWTPEPEGAAQPEVDAVAFVDALRDQLGLKLEAGKSSLRSLVVDRVERPSDN